MLKHLPRRVCCCAFLRTTCITLALMVLSVATTRLCAQTASTGGFCQVIGPDGWKVDNPFKAEVFIENNGQFDLPDGQPLKDVKYGINNGEMKVYFTPEGLSYHMINLKLKSRYNREEGRERILEEVEEYNRDGRKPDERLSRFFNDQSAYVHMQWLGANPNAEMVVEDQVHDTYSYLGKNPPMEGRSIIAKAYRKLIYKNIYPHIDVEYMFPENVGSTLGVKYSIIVHPGGDISQVKMRYSGMQAVSKDDDGNVVLAVPEGNITDHAPSLSYIGHEGRRVSARFILHENVVSFAVPDYDKTQTLVIDPFTSIWSITPGFTSTNGGYTIRMDYHHNVYVMGGGVSNGGFTPSYNYQVKKFNSSGVAQWTATGLASTNLGAYGDMVVLKGGKAIVGMGIGAGSTGYILATTNGAITTRNVPNVSEFGWRLFYNTVTNNGVLWAGGGSNNGAHLVKTDTSLTTGTIYCPWGTAGNTEDICYLTTDRTSSFVYITNATNTSPNSSTTAPKFCKSSTATPGTAVWRVNEPSLMMELGQGSFINPGASPFARGWSTGVNNMVVCNDRIYTYDGNNLRAYDPASGNIVKQITVGGGFDKYGGLDVDSCCRVYVGVNGVVKRYTSDLVFDVSFPVTNDVYDLKFDPLSDDTLYVTGKGFVQKLAPITCPTCIDTASTPVQGCVLGTGTVTVNDPSATPPFHYIWSTGDTTQTITGLTPGTYYVTVTDANQDVCANALQWIDTVIVKGVYVPCGPILNITATPDTICMGECTDLLANTTEGATPYTYAWDNGITSTTEGPIHVCPATTTRYHATVTDNDGNTDTASVLVTVTPAPTLSITSTPITCNGDCDGTATVTATGGITPYTYVWDDAGSQTSATITGLCAGTYHVTVSTPNGCADTISVTLTEPTPVTSSATGVDPSCNGSCNGTATVTASGGTPGYTYTWDDPSSQTSATASGLCSGTYQVTVTDVNGCTSTTSVTLAEPTLITLAPDSTEADCSASNGTASVTASGGTPGYTYLWDDPSSQTSATATGLPLGVYTVTVTDSQGCTTSITISVNEAGGFAANVTNTDVTCNGACNGTATVTPTGGVTPHTYLWSPGGQTTQTATGLCPGTYSVTATDANGCSGSKTVTITEPTALVISETHTDVSCNGGSDGSIDLTSTGGVNPYSYSWDLPATTQDLSGLGAGTYCVTVTDANGCTATLCADITEPTVITSSASSTKTSCTQCNGTGTVTASGGTPALSYLWDAGAGNQTSATATGLCEGTYTVTVTDAAGCTRTDSVVVVMEDKPVVCFSDSTEGCVPLNVGFVNCSTGGDTYFWEFGDGSTSDQVNPSHMFADAGCYDITLTVTTAKGCSASLSKSCYISAHPLPTASFDADPWNTTILSPTVSFLDKSINATAWSWNFGDNSTDTSQNPTHVYKDTGCYNVTLALINQYGCVDTLSQTVCVKDIFTFYMPDAFSPNGDGINETFKPVQYGVCTFEMYIFDRWGNLIYETTSLAGWDGTANEGADMVQEDVYVWLVKAEDCDGRLIQRIGRVTVIK